MPPRSIYRARSLLVLIALWSSGALAQTRPVLPFFPGVPFPWAAELDVAVEYLTGFDAGRREATREAEADMFVLITTCCSDSFDEEQRLLRERYGVELRAFGSGDIYAHQAGYLDGYGAVMGSRVASRVARGAFQALQAEARATVHPEIINEMDRSALVGLAHATLGHVVRSLQPLEWGEPVTRSTSGDTEEVEFRRRRFGEMATHTRLVVRLVNGGLREFELSFSP